MKRRGITLLEVTITVALTGILLASTAVLLTVLFRTEVQIRRDLAQQTTLARLNQRFRSDVHMATEVAAAERAATEGCRLELADGRTIEYAWMPPRITRMVQRDSKVEHRDAFELPRGARVSFAVAPEPRQMATLTIAAGDELPHRYATPVRPAEIEAVVNLHSQGEPRAEATP
jgi:type II secretory pathway pseudopilin PulG